MQNQCSGKKAYDSERAARRSARGVRDHFGERFVHAYLCPDCHRYHAGHLDPRTHDRPTRGERNSIPSMAMQRLPRIDVLAATLALSASDYAYADAAEAS